MSDLEKIKSFKNSVDNLNTILPDIVSKVTHLNQLYNGDATFINSLINNHDMLKTIQDFQFSSKSFLDEI